MSIWFTDARCLSALSVGFAKSVQADLIYSHLTQL